jgi:DNA-binding NtrC family response regulator
VYVAADISGAMNVLEREQIDVLFTDLRLGSEDGMQLIDRALKMPRPPICIMMTAYGSVDVAVEAMKRGAYDFVTKPLNLDKVELLIARAVQSRKTGAGKSCAPSASGRALRARKYLGRLGRVA